MQRLREVWCYLESWPRATIYQIGDDLGIHPTTAQYHLRMLAERRIISTIRGETRVLLRRYSAEWLEDA